MKISGFTMVRNATKLYYPIKQAIQSILPICDEFVVALGQGDPDDQTLREIQSINSDKIKIINTVWDMEKYPRGSIHAHQSDLAKDACTGDWLFYIQADEIVHEKYLPVVKQRCEELLNDKEVEGLLFRYKHFWGDYNHYVLSHTWYYDEIRIVRNDREIHSWWTAQSFRRIPNFDGTTYRTREGTFKLKVARVDAYIFHYGFVRPPRFMQRKDKAFNTIHRGSAHTEKRFKGVNELFDYGNMSLLKVYEDTHPKVMKDMIEQFDWGDQLRYVDDKRYIKHKHEKIKYRIISWIEQNLLRGRQMYGFKNYILLKNK